jgi:hypothetical protein
MRDVILVGGAPTTRSAEFESKRGAHKILCLVLLTSGALAIFALSLKALPMPFVWIDLTWAAALIGGLFFLERSWPRAILFNISFALVLLAACEAYLSLHGTASDPPKYYDTFFIKDDLLGTVPPKSVRVRAASRSFDVNYTIGSNGLRIAPPIEKDKHADCIAFFGCSFTFGQGLEDTETLPYQVGIQSGGQYRPFNFAFQGYGPHQMLAMIEQGRVGRIVDCSPKYAIYVAITDHVRRAAGKVPYGKHSPRYKLDPDGNVRRDGNFDQNQRTPSPFESQVRWELDKSAIYRALANREQRVSEDDVRLTLAIVRRSRDLLAAEYPGIQFHVILWRPWEEDAAIYRELQDGFRQMNIPVHLVEGILPGFTLATAGKYAISPVDGHPNALANRIIANYVLTQIVSPESGGHVSPLPPSQQEQSTTDERGSYPTK